MLDFFHGVRNRPFPKFALLIFPSFSRHNLNIVFPHPSPTLITSSSFPSFTILFFVHHWPLAKQVANSILHPSIIFKFLHILFFIHHHNLPSSLASAFTAVVVPHLNHCKSSYFQFVIHIAIFLRPHILRFVLVYNSFKSVLFFAVHQYRLQIKLRINRLSSLLKNRPRLKIKLSSLRLKLLNIKNRFIC